MLITIISDASFDHLRYCCGYNYYIKSALLTTHRSGSANNIHSSCEAELYGLLCAVEVAEDFHTTKQPLTYLLQCDSLQALGQLIHFAQAKSVHTHKHKIRPLATSTAGEQSLSTRIRNTIGTSLLYVKHVKGHSSINDPRHYLNRRCDAAAREALNHHRSKL